MSINKPAYEILYDTLMDDNDIFDMVYGALPLDHPVRKYWGNIDWDCQLFDNLQDEMALLLNEVLES